MNYCIFAIDDRRKHYTDEIRRVMGESYWFNEAKVWTVNGNDDEDLHYAQEMWPFTVRWHGTGNVPVHPRRGQLGIWYSVLNALDPNDGLFPFVTFEDDAILHPRFHSLFWEITTRLPKDADCFSLFLPMDQNHVYQANRHELDVAPGLCKAYQRYGGVSMLWTEKGAEKFRTLLRRDGIYDQWDNQLYQYAKSGEMNVYTQPPSTDVLVAISGREESIVQESDFL